MKNFFAKNAVAGWHFLALTLVLSFFAFSGTSFGFQSMHREHSKMTHRCMRFGKFRNMGMLIRELRITKFQLRKLKKMRRAAFKNIMKMRKNMKNPVLAATENGAFDKSAFDAAALSNAKIMIKMKEEEMQNFFGILTPRQKEEFVILMKIRKGDWSWYKGR